MKFYIHPATKPSKPSKGARKGTGAVAFEGFVGFEGRRCLEGQLSKSKRENEPIRRRSIRKTPKGKDNFRHGAMQFAYNSHETETTTTTEKANIADQPTK